MDNADLQLLNQTFDWIPPELLELYSDPTRHPSLKYIRLMTPREAVSETENLNKGILTVFGRVLWTWTDDNSNYWGVCLEDPLKGWIIALEHDGDSDVPYFRSISSLINYFRENAHDILFITGEFPLDHPSPHLDEDREIVKHFKKKCLDETDPDKRAKLGIVAIRLTPVEDTETLLEYLYINNMWVPSEAIRLLRKRGFQGGIKQMEDLASDGMPNGNMAAIRYLKEFAPIDSLLRVRDRLIKRSEACLAPGTPQQKKRDEINKRGADYALEQLKKLL